MNLRTVCIAVALFIYILTNSVQGLKFHHNFAVQCLESDALQYFSIYFLNKTDK